MGALVELGGDAPSSRSAGLEGGPIAASLEPEEHKPRAHTVGVDPLCTAGPTAGRQGRLSVHSAAVADDAALVVKRRAALQKKRLQK